ncbi:MAG TPA: DUF6587 family protein [Spongiibacteraceae bacterium]|jgi:hypothetical protein
MKIYDIVQWSIILSALLLSSLYMLGRIAPQWRVQLAQHLQQPNYARWINNFGSRIARAAGCGSGCNTCGTCATPNSSNKK